MISMTHEKFIELAREIRAAHDLRPPTETQARIWWEVCGAVPEGRPLSWIRQRLLEAEACPRNLGSEVLRLWTGWREAHPEMRLSEPRKCPDCDEPGLIYTWKARRPGIETGEMFYERGMAVCACHPSKIGKTKKQLKLEGYIVMPQGSRKGALEFERDNGLLSCTAVCDGRHGTDGVNRARGAWAAFRVTANSVRIGSGPASVSRARPVSARTGGSGV